MKDRIDIIDITDEKTPSILPLLGIFVQDYDLILRSKIIQTSLLNDVMSTVDPELVSAFKTFDGLKKVKPNKLYNFHSIFDLPRKYWYFVRAELLYDRQFVLGLKVPKSFREALRTYYKEIDSLESDHDPSVKDNIYPTESREFVPVKLVLTDISKGIITLKYYVKTVPMFKTLSVMSNKLTNEDGVWSDLYLAASGRLSPAFLPNCNINSKKAYATARHISNYAQNAWLVSSAIINIAKKLGKKKIPDEHKKFSFFIIGKEKDKKYSVLVDESPVRFICNNRISPFCGPNIQTPKLHEIPSIVYSMNFHNFFNDIYTPDWRIKHYNDIKHHKDIDFEPYRHKKRLEPSIKQARHIARNTQGFVSINYRPKTDATVYEAHASKDGTLDKISKSELDNLKEELQNTSRVSTTNPAFLTDVRLTRYPYLFLSGFPYIHDCKYDVKISMDFRFYCEKNIPFTEDRDSDTFVVNIEKEIKI